MCQIGIMKIHKKCRNSDKPVAVFIMWKGQQIGLCALCWNKVADSEFEWGEDKWEEPQLETS